MNKTITYFSTAFLMICSSLSAQESTTTQQQPEIEKISEAFGHLIGKNLESLGFEFDMQAVVQGLKDASAGKIAPMSEVECIQAITTIQEAAFKEQSQVNLAKAEDFLKKNKKTKNVVSLEKGKVQYKIEKEGAGDAVKANLSPVIRYVGKFLDGKVFGESREDEHIALDEMIPGLQTGMAGMKEGEKRVIYIHPDLAYGTRGTLPPNSLLTFEIELVKADAPLKMDEMCHDHAVNENEVAMPLEVQDNLR